VQSTLAIAAAVSAEASLSGDGLRDALDPKHK
jgi:ABC-type dipeptide/oligopeptide/nickel transport system permease subunit